MKRGLLAAGLLLFAVGIGLWGQGQLHRDAANLTAMADEVVRQAEAGDLSAAADAATNLLQRWEESTLRLSMLLNHNIIGECQQLILLLPELCREGDRAEIQQTCVLLRHRLEHLAASEALRWENIF